MELSGSKDTSLLLCRVTHVCEFIALQLNKYSSDARIVEMSRIQLFDSEARSKCLLTQVFMTKVAIEQTVFENLRTAYEEKLGQINIDIRFKYILRLQNAFFTANMNTIIF